MNPNRPTRNAQQVRTLIQNMGRSIDEARSRRLGPAQGSSGVPSVTSTGTQPSTRSGDSLDMRIGVPTAQLGGSPLGDSQRVNAHTATAQPSASSATSSATSSTARTPAVQTQTPPPVRSAHEMFSESTPRLKARPKRAS